MLLEILRRLVNYLFYRTRKATMEGLNDHMLRDIGCEPRNRLPTREHWTDHYL